MGGAVVGFAVALAVGCGVVVLVAWAVGLVEGAGACGSCVGSEDWMTGGVASAVLAASLAAAKSR